MSAETECPDDLWPKIAQILSTPAFGIRERLLSRIGGKRAENQLIRESVCLACLERTR